MVMIPTSLGFAALDGSTMGRQLITWPRSLLAASRTVVLGEAVTTCSDMRSATVRSESPFERRLPMSVADSTPTTSFLSVTTKWRIFLAPIRLRASSMLAWGEMVSTERVMIS